MANHKSSLKRIRQTEVRKTSNKYYAKTTRNAIKAIKTSTDKAEVDTKLPLTVAMIDKLAKKNIIHKNKAANLKSKLQRLSNSLA